MLNSIRTSISLPENLLKKIKEYNLNVSKVCQNALEKKIKIEEENNQKKLSLKKLKKIYYQKGFETGRLSEKNISEYELKMSLSTLKGEGRYSIWNIVDRVDDTFERNFDYQILKDHFYIYDYGWVLRDNEILKKSEYFWFTTDKPVDKLIQDYRAEALFEYKYGFAMGLCNIREIINPIRTEPIVSKAKGIIKNDKLTKRQAIEIVQKEIDIPLNNQNTIFSNPNNANDLWWFEPTYEKLKSNFFLILNDNKDRVLFFFNILDEEIKIRSFRDRPEKRRVSITIENNDRLNFMDINSGSSNVKFAKYLIKTIKY